MFEISEALAISHNGCGQMSTHLSTWVQKADEPFGERVRCRDPFEVDFSAEALLHIARAFDISNASRNFEHVAGRVTSP